MRYLPEREFPKYAFVPGENPHPLKAGGHMELSGEPESYALTDENFKDHKDYLYSLDLINHGYFWEAHAYLEAIWNENGRSGNHADLCKALIKIAASGIKKKQDSRPSALGHLKRAYELFDSIESEVFCGLNLIDLKSQIKDMNLEDLRDIRLTLID